MIGDESSAKPEFCAECGTKLGPVRYFTRTNEKPLCPGCATPTAEPAPTAAPEVDLPGMDQLAAMSDTIDYAINAGLGTKPEHPSLGLTHLRGMVERAHAAGNFSAGKLGRWLGWVQCAVVAADIGLTLDDMKAINRKHARGPIAAPIEGAGWVMVPVEPTPEMLSAVWSVRAANGKDVAQACYAAMLSARPAPVAGGPSIIRNEAAGFSEVIAADVPTVTGQMFAANVEPIYDLATRKVVGWRVWDGENAPAPLPTAGAREAVIEECAKIADEACRAAIMDPISPMHGAGRIVAATAIAAAIRALAASATEGRDASPPHGKEGEAE